MAPAGAEPKLNSRRSDETSSFARTKLTRPPAGTADMFPAVSASGRYVLFVRTFSSAELPQADAMLWIADLKLHTVQSTGIRAFDPQISPDHRSVAFSTFDSKANFDAVLDSSIPVAIRLRTPVEDSVRISWNPNGNQIAFAERRVITILSPASGARSAIRADGKVGTPSWSPDGSLLAYIVLNPSRDPHATGAHLVVAAQNGDILATHTLDSPIRVDQSLIWKRHAAGIVISGTSGGKRALIEYPLRGEGQRRIPLPAGSVAVRSNIEGPLPGGEIIADCVFHDNIDRICALDMATAKWRFVTAGPRDEFPLVSPDGKWLEYTHFASSRTGAASSLGIARLDRNDAEHVPSFPAPNLTVCWSPESDFLVVTDADGGLSLIRISQTRGGQAASHH